MNTTSFYKKILCNILIVSSLVTGSVMGIAYANTDDDKTSKPEANSDGVRAAISDTAITSKIKTQFSSDNRLKNANISVTTTNGVVTLDGTVNDSDTKSLAEDKAESVEGVKNVDNNLVTPDSNQSMDRTKEAVSDSWITTKVKSELLADSIAKGFDVNVETTDGVVVLKGFLDNQDAIDHVKDVASKVKGVKSVDISNLHVDG